MPAAFDLMAAAFDLIAAAFDLNTAALNQMLQNKFIPQHLLFGLHSAILQPQPTLLQSNKLFKGFKHCIKGQAGCLCREGEGRMTTMDESGQWIT